jgi:hypothetical protein
MNSRPFGYIDWLRYQYSSKAFRFPRKEALASLLVGSQIEKAPKGALSVFVGNGDTSVILTISMV